MQQFQAIPAEPLGHGEDKTFQLDVGRLKMELEWVKKKAAAFG